MNPNAIDENIFKVSIASCDTKFKIYGPINKPAIKNPVTYGNFTFLTILENNRPANKIITTSNNILSFID